MNWAAILPAAGLGTRIRPLIGEGSKEMVRLAEEPAIAGALREVLAAGLQRVVVVVDPQKRDLCDWLAQLNVGGVDLHIATQPEPLGVLDAVARGRALVPADRQVVLFPDHVQLPDQTGLRRVRAAIESECAPAEATWYGLIRMDGRRSQLLGPTARVETTALGGGRHRIHGLGPARPAVVGALHTFLLEAPGAAQLELLPDGCTDERLLPALVELARGGLLYGCEIGDDGLDLGWPAGLQDARDRFARGRAVWRQEATL